MKISSLKRIIREAVNEVLDEIDEVTTTAAEPGYQTPNAFQGNKPENKTKRKQVASQAGMTIVGKDEEPDKLTEGKGEETFILWAMPKGQTDRLHERPLTSFPITR